MGVKGLWSLLNPVARPVHMEGKRLAIDSSIWLYQFQATMRDKDGRVLVNAHVLGFLRRINKLLFHGIKPVFVFDGGAPVLKRATIAERKRKRQGAVVNHARTAEKLFAAQMRREAVKAAQAQREQVAARQAAAMSETATRYDDDEGDQIAADATYLDDLENAHAGPSRPRPTPARGSASDIVAAVNDEPLDPAEERRKKFRKHDPYRLPEASMPTVSTDEKPDARLATEEELKQFIDDMKPSDIDIESAEFRALPTEVQYEIIGDLRIRSRQQSHQRLASMLRGAPTALDFSMQQIKHLSERNTLTQQLLTVTDMVGKAHLTIPVRIAAERNREYVLLKRGEDVGGGWALGIREGTKQKPIEVTEEKEEESSSVDGSEGSDDEVVEIPKPAVDPDLAEHRRRQILDAITSRYASARASPRKSLDVPVTPFGASHAPSQPQLFDDPDMFADMEDDSTAIIPTANDEALALALQQEELGSDEEEADPELARALAMSRREKEEKDSVGYPGSAGTGGGSVNGNEDEGMSDDSMEEVELVPSEQSTPALEEPPFLEDSEDDFEEVPAPAPVPVPVPVNPSPDILAPTPIPVAALLSAKKASRSAQQPPTRTNATAGPSKARDIEVVAPPSTLPLPIPRVNKSPITVLDDEDDDAPVFAGMQPAPSRSSRHPSAPARPADDSGSRYTVRPAEEEAGPSRSHSFSDIPPVDEFIQRSREGGPPLPSRSSSLLNRPSVPSPLSRSPSFVPPVRTPSGSVIPDRLPRAGPSPPPPPMHLGLVAPEPERLIDEALAGATGAWRTGSNTPPAPEPDDEEMDGDDEEADEDRGHRRRGDDDDEEEDPDESGSIAWSRSPTPTKHPRPRARPPLQAGASTDTIPSEVEEEDVDMNAEDMVEEQDDYARFLAQIKNRDLNEVRTEIDDEIRVLHGQNKVAQRDSDEITMPMIAQIQTLLRHFGIPYITAPMEAEAQCAKLAELGLVDGIITDDSDVFLFGGTQCFKNIFNDNKYAECFLATDINRELSLSRERLISLAYLLGSDYTIGLPGVGPVVALELLANFPGERGIEEFKEWWAKVQKGQDGAETDNKWKASFKKRYTGGIFITADWPNPLVREAYRYPVTDESEEAFHWGFPKLSALRSFLHEELSWSISKVDDELTPIVQRIARRGKAGSLNKQSTLDPFFDLSAGALANYAPRKRTTANVSKRLLSVIKQFREAEAKASGTGEVVEWGAMMQGLDEEDPKGRGTGKKRSIKASELGDGDGDGDDDSLLEADVGEKKREVKKRKPRRKKGEVASTEAGTEDGMTEMGSPAPAAPPAKKARKPRAKKAAAAAPSVIPDDVVEDGEGEGSVFGEQEEVTDISQVPVDQRRKWKRAQQKTWRRAAVANSLKPN